jgi:hypothetical protein
MDPLRILTAECGFFTRSEAREAGYDDRAVARMVQQRVWVRFRRGAYAFADEWHQLPEVGKHRVRSSAVLRSIGDVVALSHVSGVIRHDIDVWGVPLTRVHVTRLDGGAGRIERDVVHHEGLALDDDVRVVDHEKVLRPERCVLEAGSRASNEVALCLMEAGLRRRAFDRKQLQAMFRALQFWPFMRHLHIPIRIADGRSGSIGESRGIWAFHTLRIPIPERQAEVVDHSGLVVAVTDWHWPSYDMYGEFDGKVKYGRLLRPDQTPGDAVFDEKKREDLIREVTNSKMFRLIWSDYDDPRSILTRFDRLAGRRAG